MFYKSAEDYYKNPQDYDSELIGSDDKEISFYSSYIKEGSVLYLGSGSGRLLRHFLLINENITGIEISREMVKRCLELLPKAKILEQDVLNLNLKNKFDVIIAPYRFLCHFDKINIQKLFKVVSDHLKEGGIFVGDLFSPYEPKDRSIRVEFEDFLFYDDHVEKVYNLYDHVEQLCTEILERDYYEGGRMDFIKLVWHYYYPEQLTVNAKKVDLVQHGLYGSFTKDTFTEKSKHVIFEYQKS